MTPDADRRPGRLRWRALGLLGGVQFMLILDETVVNVALASIRGELGFDAAGLTWVVNAYLLSFGGLLLVGGRAGDVFGRRRVLVVGLWVFGAASLACGLAAEPWHLVVGRTAQGIGAALISPTALALVSRIFVDPAERARAFSVWGALAVVGGTTGVVISGWLTEVISWRAVFLVNLLPVAAAVLVAPRLLADSHDRRRPALSLSAVVLATVATACLVQGLLVAGEDRSSVLALGWVATSVVAALLFVRIERRSDHRLVPPSVLALPVRRRAHIACLLLSGSFLGLCVLLVLHLQTVLAFSPLQAGLGYLPYAGGTLLGVWASQRLQRAFGVGPTIAVSFSTAALGLGWLSLLPVDADYVRDILPGLFVAALGSGLGFPAVTAAAMTDTDETDAGSAAAVLSTMQQVGSVLGLAALVGVAVRRTASVVDGGRPADVAQTEGLSFALTVAALALLSAVLVRVAHRSRRSRRV